MAGANQPGLKPQRVGNNAEHLWRWVEAWRLSDVESHGRFSNQYWIKICATITRDLIKLINYNFFS